MHGILFDLPEVVQGAYGIIEAEGLAERCEVVGGSFFDEVPSGGASYAASSTRAKRARLRRRAASPKPGIALTMRCNRSSPVAVRDIRRSAKPQR